MFAVVNEGGHQYRVQAGDTLLVDCAESNPGDSLKFEEVLLAGAKSGRPSDVRRFRASVTAEVVEHRLGQELLLGIRRRRKASQRRGRPSPARHGDQDHISGRSRLERLTPGRRTSSRFLGMATA